VGSLVEKMVPRQVFLSLRQFFPVSIIAPELHTHSSTTNAMQYLKLTASLYNTLKTFGVIFNMATLQKCEYVYDNIQISVCTREIRVYYCYYYCGYYY
jgi:hypothetical protein